MAIDIDKLTEPELVDLNNRIVARLKFLQQMRAHASMLEFGPSSFRVEPNTDNCRWHRADRAVNGGGSECWS